VPVRRVNASSKETEGGSARSMQISQPTVQPRPPLSSPRVIAGLTMRLGILLCAGVNADTASAQASVFRCTAPDGSIEFRQHACHQTSTSTKIEIDDRRTGWVPPAGVKPGSPKSEKRTRKKRPKTTENEDKYADRCWNKRQQIERINSKLRAGYKTAQGVKLRRRRAEHEAFLSRYCR